MMKQLIGPDQYRVFRITHVDNIPWILDNGLHCESSDVRDENYVSIGMADLISKRRRRSVPVDPGGVLADYVPFYFTPKSIMLYNIKTGYNGVTRRPNDEIVLLVSRLPQLSDAGVKYIFTDGHAYPTETEYFDDDNDLDQVDWELLYTCDFERDPNDPGKLTRYQAEALVYQHVPVDALTGIVCNSDRVKKRLQQQIDDRGLGYGVVTRPRWYF
ncbi:MAG: DUF4433 domain-containing protein [Planctomycetota bacterium]